MSGLSAIFEERRAEIRRFLVARTGSEADADDLLNDLWLKIGSAPAGPVGNPVSYLYKMANNIVLDRLREARRRSRRESDWSEEQIGPGSQAAEVPDPAPDAEAAMIDRGEVARLRSAIDQLPEGARRVLRMHKLEELSHAEVATRLGISKSTVEKHMAVAMNHLRRLLKD